MILMTRKRRSIWILMWGVGSREVGNWKSEVYPEGETTAGRAVLQGGLTDPQLFNFRTFQP